MKNAIGIVLACISLLWIVTAGAQPAEVSGTAVPAAEWVRTELYLGRDVTGGTEVAQDQFADFLDKVVTSYFPKGLTVFEAYGQMKHKDGHIEKQATFVILIVHEKTDNNIQSVQEIVNAYRKQFAGAQIMVTTAPTSAQFYAD